MPFGVGVGTGVVIVIDHFYHLVVGTDKLCRQRDDHRVGGQIEDDRVGVEVRKDLMGVGTVAIVVRIGAFANGPLPFGFGLGLAAFKSFAYPSEADRFDGLFDDGERSKD